MVIDAAGPEQITRNWFQSKFDLDNEAIMEGLPPQMTKKPFTKVEGSQRYIRGSQTPLVGNLA